MFLVWRTGSNAVWIHAEDRYQAAREFRECHTALFDAAAYVSDGESTYEVWL